jgi:hypothetical protein
MTDEGGRDLDMSIYPGYELEENVLELRTQAARGEGF